MHLYHGLGRCIKNQIMKKLFVIMFLSLISACYKPDHSGFYNPITFSMTVPDGPPEYKAGWYAGCKTGSSLKTFANNSVFRKDAGPDFGSGVYAHDSLYQSGWGQGWFACSNHIGMFSERLMGGYPLE